MVGQMMNDFSPLLPRRGHVSLDENLLVVQVQGRGGDLLLGLLLVRLEFFVGDFLVAEGAVRIRDPELAAAADQPEDDRQPHARPGNLGPGQFLRGVADTRRTTTTNRPQSPRRKGRGNAN